MKTKYSSVPPSFQHCAKEWISWRCAKNRCYNKKNPSYKYCGAKGIVMCDAWRYNFRQFFADMGYAPSPQHTIDRIDNTKGYEPGNCRWATPYEQQLNTTKVKWFTIDNETKCFSDWCRAMGINSGTVSSRLRMGWNIKDALTKKPDQKHNGHTYS